VVVSGLLLNIHPQRLQAALDALGTTHAPRFDPFWMVDEPLDQALRAADREKARRDELTELEHAQSALLAVAQRGDSADDPAVQRARARLDSVLTRKSAGLAVDRELLDARADRMRRQFEQLRWAGAIGVVVVLVAVVAKLLARV
jgi:hypothetical protein